MEVNMAKKIFLFLFSSIAFIGLMHVYNCPSPDSGPDSAPAAPSGLHIIDDVIDCTIEWTDNSDNESGFRIYSIGKDCVDCTGVIGKDILIDTVGADVTSYSWGDTCCNVGQCLCVEVRAYNSKGESESSNVIMLSPVCYLFYRFKAYS
jgi:hypothetical protein